MSADDFQTKYASVMESILKGAVAETTKLFETMVDELKAEISRIKRENEDLKTRCSRFESARGQANVCVRASERPLRRSDILETRDTAVQCDLPFRMMLVEQCQPLSQSLQNQKQRGYEMESALREHDYETHGEESSQMVILVKQEQEEVESTVVYGQDLSDKEDSPWASPCGNEKEGNFIHKICSNRERPLPQRCEETQVLPEIPSSGTYSGLQGAQNQSSELEPSLVISVPAIKDNMEEEPEITQEMSETGTQRERMTTEKQLLVIESLDKEQPSVVPQQCQREDSVNDQSDVTLKQYIDVYSPQEQLAHSTQLNRGEACDELKNGVAEVEASSQPDLSICRRRGRPPKKAKLLQQPVKEILQPPSSDTPTEQEVKRSPRIRVKEVKVSSAVHTDNITSSESPQGFPVQPKEPPSIITRSSQERENIALEDVENTKVASVAASGSSLSRGCSSEKGKASESQQITTDMEEGAIQATSTEVSSAVETGNTPPAESSRAPSVQPRERQTSVTLQDAILLVEAMNRSMVENTSSSVQKTTQTTMQKLGAPPQSTDVTATNEAQAHIEFVLPTSVSNTTTSSKSPSTVGTQTSVQSLQQKRPLTTALAPRRRANSVTHKIIIVPRAVSSLGPQKLAAQSPIHLAAVVSRKRPLQTNALTTQESTSPVKVTSSQELSIFVGTHTTVEKVDITSSQKRDITSNILESPKQTASVSETLNAHPESCSSLNRSVGQVPTIMSPIVGLTAEQSLSAVVKLTRLPFSVSTREPILIARQQKNGPSDSQSALKDGTTEEKTSSVFMPIQPAETFVLSTDICPSLKETFGAVSVKTCQMSEELNNNQEKALFSTEKCTTMEQLPNGGCVQPTKVSQPVFEKSAVTINKIQPSVMSDTAGETTSNLDEEIPNDQPTEERPAALIHLTSITSKDTPDAHLQMTKDHFLAQLVVSPVAQDPEKVSSNDGVDDKASCAETSTCDKKRLQKNSLISQLRSRVNTYLQTKRTEANAELCTETKTHTVNLKKPRLESDHLVDENTTNELVSLSPKTPPRITIDPPTISSRRSGLCEDGVKPKRTVGESSSVSSRRCKASESSPVSLRRSNPTKGFATPEKTRSTFALRRRSSSTGDSTSPNNAKTTSVRPKRISSNRGGGTPAKTTSLSPRTPHSSKNGTSPKMSTSESPSVIRRRCTFTKDGFSTKQIKTGPDSFSLRSSSTTTYGASPENIKRETDSPSVWLPALAKDGVSLRKTRDCTRVVNAKKLAKAAKAKTIAKVKNSKQSKVQNESSSENRAKKCAATGVWTPPRIPASKTASGGEMSLAQLPVKKEARSLDCSVVYPPSVTLHPIPVKAPPVVSPLQPLSVIGRRLLRNQCGECGCVFSSSVALESHVSLHTSQQPFSCKLCGKRFSDSKGLKRHDRVHRNGRIHVCQKCGKGFAYRFCLTKHIQVVHSKIKPFVCQVCDKGYFTKRDVEAHIRIHTGEKPFHCNLCEKKFARRVELNVHLRWHNGEKRHWCPYCGKGFLDFNNLKRHKYIHTGEKPHSCPHCPKNFTQSGHLKKHVKNVHKIQ